MFILFADVEFVDESSDVMNAKFKRWWEALESNDVEISHRKIKYMNYNLSEDVQRDLRIEVKRDIAKRFFNFDILTI